MIDEQIVGMKSRTSIVQYMTKKSERFGVNISVLCESKSALKLQLSSYENKSLKSILSKTIFLAENECKTPYGCLTFNAFLFLRDNYKGKERDNQELGLSYRVVMNLMRVYLD